MNNNHLPNL